MQKFCKSRDEETDEFVGEGIESESDTCSYCGAEDSLSEPNGIGDRTCSKCGVEFDKSDSIVMNPYADDPSESFLDESSTDDFDDSEAMECPNCGKDIGVKSDGTYHCEFCDASGNVENLATEEAEEDWAQWNSDYFEARMAAGYHSTVDLPAISRKFPDAVDDYDDRVMIYSEKLLRNFFDQGLSAEEAIDKLSR